MNQQEPRPVACCCWTQSKTRIVVHDPDRAGAGEGRKARRLGISVDVVRANPPEDVSNFSGFWISIFFKSEYAAFRYVSFPDSGLSLHFLDS